MNTVKLNILENTFNQSFNLERYKVFIREFLNGPDFFPSIRSTGIWKEYSGHIDAYYRVANYTDGDGNNLIVIAVEIKREGSVERARAMQRNFVSKVLDENNYSAAIVAFYSPNEINWRLSFVRLDYTFNEKGLDLDLTPARRYSYLVGKYEPNHTAKAQLLPILKNDKTKPTIDAIEEAFSVEKVTKDFFKQYKEKYLQLKEYLEQDEAFIKETQKLGFKVPDFAEQFSKKLLGQLAFLYFLQKKGWLGVIIVPKKISKKDLTTIFNNVNDVSKDVLRKVYKTDNNGEYILDTLLIASDNFSDRETDTLTDIFIKTKYNQEWGNGYKKFIVDVLWRHSQNSNRNFFNDYLEPFFYDALNKKRHNQYFKGFNCKIPFLNGGLFEPLEGYHWRDINFNIPNSIFSNVDQKNRDADGILDIFECYNFTMNEDEPLEKEVAIDPEMLGKIFENLLEISDRKSKGAFYTPREIVHYMCQESLANYLVNEVKVPYEDIKEFILYGDLIRDTDHRSGVGFNKELIIKQSIYNNIVIIDRALENAKIADPAVGSGAFPLGMLSEIVRMRNNITDYILKLEQQGELGVTLGDSFLKRRSSFQLKWDTIKNSIFAVDIDPSAIDIAKLRLWLSVVVDQEINDMTPEPHPLPNLDMNIRVGNSLIDEYEGIRLFDNDVLKRERGNSKGKNEVTQSEQYSFLIDHSDDMLSDMFKLQDSYFGEEDETRKKELKQKIDYVRDELIEYKLSKDRNKKGYKKYLELKKKREKPYFLWYLEFAKVFSDNGGFDIVIGNPPYIGESKGKGNFLLVQNSSFGKEYYMGKMDFWYFFTSKGIELLKTDGILNFIAPNNWNTTFGGKKMRSHILKDTKINKIINFKDYMVFENANQQTMVFVLKKSKNIAGDYKVEYSEISRKKVTDEQLQEFLRGGLSKGTKHYTAIIDPKSNENKLSIHFLEESIFRLTQKIKKGKTLYLDKDDIGQGIVSPQDNLNKKGCDILNGQHQVGTGIFVLNHLEKEMLNLNLAESKLVKPYYTTEEIIKYAINPINQYWIIYTKSDINKHISKYPNIKKHLDEFKEVITSSNKPYGLHRARNEKLFLGEKIISIRKAYEPTFAYADFPTYVSQTFNVIQTNKVNMKYLTGLLNSKLVAFWLYHKGKIQGSNYQVDSGPLMNIPIKVDKESVEVESLVNRILELINVNNFKNEYKSKIVVYRRQIDDMIYKIYNLSLDEINIIEEFYRSR